MQTSTKRTGLTLSMAIAEKRGERGSLCAAAYTMLDEDGPLFSGSLLIDETTRHRARLFGLLDALQTLRETQGLLERFVVRWATDALPMAQSNVRAMREIMQGRTPTRKVGNEVVPLANLGVLQQVALLAEQVQLKAIDRVDISAIEWRLCMLNAKQRLKLGGPNRIDGGGKHKRRSKGKVSAETQPSFNLMPQMWQLPSYANLSTWEADVFAAYGHTVRQGQRHFLLQSCPGSNQQRVALAIANQMLKCGFVRRVVTAVPTRYQQQSWGLCAAEMYQLNWASDVDWKVWGNKFSGYVGRYNDVLGGRWDKKETLVIFVDIEHGYETLGRSHALAKLGKDVPYTLNLCRAPLRLRRRHMPHPHLTYSSEKIAEPDFSLSRQQAIETGMFEPTYFTCFGRPKKGPLPLTDNELAEMYLNVQSQIGRMWLRPILSRAQQELTQRRLKQLDAAAVIYVKNRKQAKQLAPLVCAMSGTEPILAIGDSLTTARNLQRFTDGTGRWVIIDRAIAPYVTLPRVQVIVYLAPIVDETSLYRVLGELGEKSNRACFALGVVPQLNERIKLLAGQQTGTARFVGRVSEEVVQVSAETSPDSPIDDAFLQQLQLFESKRNSRGHLLRQVQSAVQRIARQQGILERHLQAELNRVQLIKRQSACTDEMLADRIHILGRWEKEGVPAWT